MTGDRNLAVRIDAADTILKEVVDDLEDLEKITLALSQARLVNPA